MKLTNEVLKKLIHEELSRVINEDMQKGEGIVQNALVNLGRVSMMTGQGDYTTSIADGYEDTIISANGKLAATVYKDGYILVNPQDQELAIEVQRLAMERGHGDIVKNFRAAARRKY